MKDRADSRWPIVAGIATAIAAWAAAGPCAETVTLQLQRLSENSSEERHDLAFRSVYPQSFHVNWDVKGLKEQHTREEAAFKKAVRKEPEKYNAKVPLRRVARFGGKDFAFVLDAQKPEADYYDRLYFDLNGNGDLTDDKPLDAKFQKMFGSAVAQFPRVDLTIPGKDGPFPYAFTTQVYSRVSKDFSYASVSMTSAVYREGLLTLDGKPRKIVLLDFNSNGRFDDPVKMPAADARGQLQSEFGDILVLDPDRDDDTYSFDVTETKNRHYLSPLVNLDGHFYKAQATLSGDRLTLTPLDLPLGKVTTNLQHCRAVLGSPRGVVTLTVEKDHPASLPEGEWRLLAYTARHTDPEPPKPKPKPDAPPAKSETGPEAKTAAKSPAKTGEKTDTQTETVKKSAEPSGLVGLMLSLLKGGSPGDFSPRSRTSTVSATATSKSSVLKVAKDEVTQLRIGPPYKPVVNVQYRRDAEHVNLGLKLVGSDGEECTDMNVRGSRPGRPKLTITTPDGEVVDRGRFEYG